MGDERRTHPQPDRAAPSTSVPADAAALEGRADPDEPVMSEPDDEMQPGKHYEPL